MLFCVYVALVAAGLFTTQSIWAELLVLLTFVAIVFALIMALYAAEQRRASCGAFALMAGAYFSGERCIRAISPGSPAPRCSIR